MPSDPHYRIVADELAAEQPKPGLWARAVAESDGNLDRARGRYIKLRATEIERDEDAKRKAAVAAAKATAKAESDGMRRAKALRENPSSTTRKAMDGHSSQSSAAAPSPPPKPRHPCKILVGVFAKLSIVAFLMGLLAGGATAGFAAVLITWLIGVVLMALVWAYIKSS